METGWYAGLYLLRPLWKPITRPRVYTGTDWRKEVIEGAKRLLTHL